MATPRKSAPKSATPAKKAAAAKKASPTKKAAPAKKTAPKEKKPAASVPVGALIEPSQVAPDFRLVDQQGQPHSLADYRGKWVVLYFYPKDDTPGCTVEACEFRDDQPEFGKLDAAVLGISPDGQASHDKFVRKFSLNFPLLADEGSVVCSQYGVWQEKSMYGRTYMGVARTTYLIDPDGRVAHRWDKVKVEGHAKAVRDTIASLKR